MSENLSFSNQYKQIRRWIHIVLIIVSFWLGIRSGSLLLVSQGVLLLGLLLEIISVKRSKSVPTLVPRLNLFLVLVSAFLITLFTTLKVTEPFFKPGEIPLALRKDDISALLFLPTVAIIAELILILGLEKKQLQMGFFKDQITWFLILISGIAITVGNFIIIDFVIGLGFLIFNVVIKLNWLDKELKNVSTKNKDSKELPRNIIDAFLDLPRVDRLYDFKILETNEGEMVSGVFVMENQSNQEEIFTAKAKAKKILKENGFNESVLESQYLAEFIQNNEQGQ